jgi:hypothetical protein
MAAVKGGQSSDTAERLFALRGGLVAPRRENERGQVVDLETAEVKIGHPIVVGSQERPERIGCHGAVGGYGGKRGRPGGCCSFAAREDVAVGAPCRRDISAGGWIAPVVGVRGGREGDGSCQKRGEPYGSAIPGPNILPVVHDRALHVALMEIEQMCRIDADQLQVGRSLANGSPSVRLTSMVTAAFCFGSRGIGEIDLSRVPCRFRTVGKSHPLRCLELETEVRADGAVRFFNTVSVKAILVMTRNR